MKTVLTLGIDYDPEKTDPESLATAMDRLMETILSTPGITEEYGDPQIGEFFVAPAGLGETDSPLVVVTIDGGCLQEVYASAANIRVAAIDHDTECCTGDEPGVVSVDGKLVAVGQHDPLPLETGTPAADVLAAVGIAWAAQDSPPSAENVLRRWVLYNDDTQQLLSAETFDSYEAALDALDPRLNDVFVLPIELETLAMGSPVSEGG